MSDVGFRSDRGPILIALMFSTGLVAIDSTVIATAIPSIVDNLGGFAQFPWLFSVYLLAQAVSVPIYGKLADLVGRKPILLVGIGLFLLGSILCGVAWSMPALIAFRAVQGLGAGAVSPMTITIAADIYSLAERGKVQGYLASVWAISSVIGPTLGGVFSEYVSWRWIFFVNIPLCLFAGWILARNFHERITRRAHRLDLAGAGLLTVGCTLVMLGLLEGGHGLSRSSSFAVIAAGVVLLGVFVAVERRAAEPVLPLWVFRRRILVATNLVSLGVGAVLIGLTSYVPTFAQGVLGFGPLVAGFALAPLTLGWPITSAQSSKFYLRIGFRATGLIGAAVAVVGSALTILFGAGSSVFFIGATCFLIGAGLGLVAAPSVIAAQATVDWAERGVVTATNLFNRSMGSALGVAVFGAIGNAAIGTAGPPLPGPLAHASHLVFIAVTAAAVLMALAVALIPRVVPIVATVPTADPAWTADQPST